MNLLKIKELWGKYNWIVMLVLFAYSAYKTLVPNVKIEEKTVIKTVVDTESMTKMQTEISKLSQMKQDIATALNEMRSIAKNVKINEIITEVQNANGSVERTIHREMTDLSNMIAMTANTSNESTTKVESSTSTSSGSNSSKTHADSTIIKDKKTDKNPATLWSTIGGYQCYNQQVILGQGVNIGHNITVGVIGSYYVKDDIKNRFDVGAVVIFRY